ncbi:MAG: CHAT domain-containing tetratricopeptide repeat protein [Pseudomonadota bacterium]
MASAKKANEVLPTSGSEYLAVNVKYNLAQLNFTLGRTDDAIQSMLDVLAMDQEQENRQGMVSSLESLGEFHNRAGESSKAIWWYAEALNSLLPREKESRARILRKIAVCYQNLGQTHEAETYFSQSLALSVLDASEIANTHARLGKLYYDTKRFLLAIQAHKKSLAIFEQTGKTRYVGETHINLALSYVALDNKHSAWRSISSAEAKLTDPSDLGNNAALAYAKGLYHKAWGQPGDSQQFFKRALKTYQGNSHIMGQIQVLTAWSELLEESDQTVAAVGKINEAISLIEVSRANIGSETLRAGFFAQIRTVFEKKISLYMDLAQDDSSNIENGWRTADQLSARTLRDALHIERASLEKDNPILAKQRYELSRTLRQQLSALERATTPGLLETLQREVRATRLELDSIEQTIGEQHPSKSGMFWRDISLEEIQTRLSPQQALLQYSVGGQQSYVWTITSQDISVQTLPNRESLEKQVSEFLDGMRQKRLLGSPIHDRLSSLLLPRDSLTDEITELLVVPDGPIAYLPMGALQNHEETLIIEQFRVITLPSAATLLNDPGPPPSLSRVLVMADPVYSTDDSRYSNDASIGAAAGNRSLLPGDEPLLRLPFSADEAAAVATAGAHLDVTLLQGFDATKQALVQSKEADVIHLAAHALANASTPELSGLVLSQIDPSGQSIDGFVGLEEIYGMRGKSSLVVLSACDSALGQEILGEGLISLARGFMHNGTRNVIASQWRVPDKATSRLMAAFYNELFDKSSNLDIALRTAQLEIRRVPRWREPYYWAGFSLWGKVSKKNIVMNDTG